MCFRADCFKADVDFKVSYLNVALIGVHSNNSTLPICDDIRAPLHVSDMRGALLFLGA